MLVFSDDADEEYTAMPDTYRTDDIATISEVETALGAYLFEISTPACTNFMLFRLQRLGS